MTLPILTDFMSELTNSSSVLSSLPSAVLEATIPGYGILSNIVFRLTGIDIGLIGSGCLTLYGLFQGILRLYYWFHHLFLIYLTLEIQTDNDDYLFYDIMEWISKQRMTEFSLSLRAVSRYVSYDEEEEESEDVLDDMGIFSYEKWASNVPPRYEPNLGSDRFCFNGRTFRFTREKIENRSSWSGYDQLLTINCNGRSTKPLKELIEHIKSWKLSKEANLTSVYRPTPKNGEDSSIDWRLQCCRTSRPIDTVALDLEQKISIIRDISEYLHPATSRSYAARGIPYRRGYLFHGPPGTGKTSLSFSLAGIFGLPIYVISLTEVGLTETQLNTLFGNLPKRCIVLLEDIDSAGLRRDDLRANIKSDDSSTSSSDTEDDTSNDGVKITKTINNPAKAKADFKAGAKGKITLSGLLNVIDKTTSHKSRILIISTNYPEQLDSALIRPGRVKLQVKFTLATHTQIRDIFIRMYAVQNKDAEKIEKVKVTGNATKAVANEKEAEVQKPADAILKLLQQSVGPPKDSFTPEALADLAVRLPIWPCASPISYQKRCSHRRRSRATC